MSVNAVMGPDWKYLENGEAYEENKGIEICLTPIKKEV